MVDAGANLLAQPTPTPWNSLNARLETPGDLQVTVFQELHEPTGVAVVRDHSPSNQCEAARIWAAATAHRDNETEPATVRETLPIIENGLRPVGATLHMAYLRDKAAGFAVVVPQPRGLEIQYLGVDPTAWGSGIAGRLLSDVADYAQEQSQPEVELWVYDDNARAVDVYRRAGWSGTADVRIHPTSGRLERRHVRRIAEATCAKVHP
jgi:ribosomal protein S18 acetylase RimI-like enzyme